jgi:virginiamycin B lyase
LERLEARELLAASITEYGILTGNSGALDIARGPDGAQWFVEEAAHKIGRISASGAITEYAVSGDPVDLWAGVGPTVWFSEFYAAKVGVIHTDTGQIQEFALPTSGAGANGITLGADGNMWVGEYFKGKIARVTPTGQIAEFTVGGNPTDLALGSDGRV